MPLQKIIKKYWQNGCISFLIIALTFAYLLHLSWLKWGDLLVDVGSQMYIPSQILSGKILYRDFCYVYGPFSPYFNGLLYKLFGRHLYTLFINGLLTAIAASFLIYKISRSLLGVFFSTLAVLNFLIVFAFGHYVYYGNYNFILPYTYASINGLVFALAAVYLFYLSISRGPARFKYLSSLFITLTLLAKIEIGLALIVSVTAAFFLYAKTSEKKPPLKFRTLLNRSITYSLLPLAVAGIIYSAFLLPMPGSALKKFLFDIMFLNIDTGYIFTGWMSGLQNLPQNLNIILRALLGYTLLIILFSGGGFFIRRLQRRKPGFLKQGLPVILGAVFICVGLAFIKGNFAADWQYRPLPIIVLLAAAISMSKLLKKEGEGGKGQWILVFCLCLFSFALMLRMLFFVRPAHFGFYIAVPGMIIYYIFFFRLLPEFLPAAISRNFYNIGMSVILIFFMAVHLNISKFCYKNRSLKISTPKGTIYTFDNSREKNILRLIDYLKRNTNKDDTLVVFPEGLTINFLAERKNPLRYYTYVPINLSTSGVEEEIIRGLESQKVTYIVINQRNTEEFGYRIFGRDYGRSIWNYIKRNYEPVKQFGPFPYTSQEFGIVLFRRNEP